MPAPDEMTTVALLTAIGDIEAAGWTGYYNELLNRVIEENDDDDSPQHRGGIRPTHQPINP